MAEKTGEYGGQFISIYNSTSVCRYGYYRKGELKIISEVYGDWDSESHYLFDRENMRKIFDCISIDVFVKVCREEGIGGLIDLAAEYDVHYEVFTI